MKWDYNNAFERYPIPEDGYIFEDGSQVMVHDVFNPLPEYMKNADLMFVDPPWNLGNINTFYYKAEKDERVDSFERFYKRLFECIKEINPKTLYIEVGKEYLAEFITEAKKQYKYVTFYNSSYYHQKKNVCYVIRASRKAKKPKLDYMDEEDIIEWVCKNEEYNCIGDLCMGRGLVGLNAYRNGKKFVGTELNHKRLSVLLERIDNEIQYKSKRQIQ